MNCPKCRLLAALKGGLVYDSVRNAYQEAERAVMAAEKALAESAPAAQAKILHTQGFDVLNYPTNGSCL